MRFSTPAATLLAALHRASGIIPTRPSMLAYSGVNLEVSAGKLTATGSDGHTTVSVTSKVSGTVTGNALMLPKPISHYLGRLDAGATVTFEKDSDTEATLSVDGAAPYRFKLIATTFPVQPSLRSEKHPVDMEGLSRAVSAVSPSATLAPNVQAIQVISTTEGVKLHSTDGYRLARAVLPPAAAFGDFDGLLSLRVLELAASVGVTTVQHDGKGRVAFSSDDTTISARLVTHPFPVVESVLGAVPIYTAKVPRLPLKAALRRLSALAEGSVPLVVDLAGNEATLSMRSNNLGSGTEVIELGAAVPSEVKFGANLEYLEQALSAHVAEDVTIGWTAAKAPVFLTSDADIPVVNVVMPVAFDY